MKVFQNMSVPPRSEVDAEIDFIGKYMEFSSYILAGEFAVELEDVPKKAEEYVKNHGLGNYPKSYMIGFNFSFSDMEEVKKRNSFFYNKLFYEGKLELCIDVGLIIAVMTKTVNDIYIPNRECSFEPRNFMRRLFFCLDDIKEGR